jgi:hypothetical protein
MGGSNQVGPTEDQIAQSEINNNMWDYYQKNYKPVINKYIATKTSKANTALEKKSMTGQINADVMKAVKPRSATNAVVNAKNMMDLSDVKANALVTGDAAVESRKMTEKQNLINIGRGQTTTAMAGMNELASMSVEDAIRDKARDEEVKGMEENAIGSTVGAVAAAGMYGALKKPKTRTIDEGFGDETKNVWGLNTINP